MNASPTKRLPWMKFYPVDWRSDALLRSCSPAARGVWIDLMTIMHEAEPYGELRINGAAATPQQLSKLVGINLKTLSGLLSELEKAGVFSRREDGVIYSRRMVRDRDKALKDKQNGEGGGNPALTKGVNPPDNPRPNGGDNATRVGACARDLTAQTLEREVKEEKKDTPKPPAVGGRSRACRENPEFAVFYANYPRKDAPDDALKAWNALIAAGVDPNDILDGLSRYAFSSNPQYIRLPAGWLRGGCWRAVTDNRDPVLVAAGFNFDTTDDDPLASLQRPERLT